MDVIYLDFNATTPCDPRVVEAMLPFFSVGFANPASRQHGPGRAAFMALENARKTVAQSIGARSATEIIFTSGATESNNLALTGVANAPGTRGRHLITQATEHPAVLEVMAHLETQGWQLTVIGVDGDGRVDPKAVTEACRPDTVLISIMLANNETGVIQPIAEITEAAHSHGITVHCDAAQGPGKIPVDIGSLGVDLLSLSGHKCYGPKGSGALFIRRKTPPLKLQALQYGGGHEQGLRSGTVNLPAAVGLAAALQLAGDQLDRMTTDVGALRDAFEHSLVDLVPGVVINGAGAPRLPNTCNVAFPGVDGEALMTSLPDLAVSSGSACASVHPEPSKVLLAMGLGKTLASGALRISLGRTSTTEDVQRAALRIAEEVHRLRK
ncbi:MAG: IscS subfamily cysteine desulfurase [Acidobacteria bacterium]|nr:MAG: IscS subfamily cysteine desulfurase [Acidobacteriota bacterium]